MIPERLILLREAYELSQRELADELHVTQSYVSQVEAGKKPASLKFIDKVSCHFKIEKSILFQRPRGTWTPDPPSGCARHAS